MFFKPVLGILFRIVVHYPVAQNFCDNRRARDRKYFCITCNNCPLIGNDIGDDARAVHA